VGRVAQSVQRLSYGVDGTGIESRWGGGARFSAPVQTGPGAHPASCTMGTRSLPGVKSGRDVTLTPHSLLVPRSRRRITCFKNCMKTHTDVVFPCVIPTSLSHGAISLTSEFRIVTVLQLCVYKCIWHRIHIQTVQYVSDLHRYTIAHA
jgi:hypothetical protein